MQQEAVDCATQALEKYNIEKDIAAYIKKEFDKKSTLPGMQLLEETLDLTLLTKLGTLFIFISDKLPFCCLKAVKNRKRRKKILILKTILILCQVYFFVFKYNE